MVAMDRRPTPPTPVLTKHAKLRCLQMGVSTKRAKHVVRYPDIVYVAPPKYPGCWLAVADSDPDIAVAFTRDEGCDRPVILTVLSRGVDFFVRPD